MKGYKALTASALVGVLLLVAPVQAFALSPVSESFGREVIEVDPFWENVSSMSLSLSSASNNSTNANVFINGRAGTTSINATITLSRVNQNGTLTAVRTWANQSSSSSSFTFSNSNAVTSGNTYRLSVSATVVRNGVNETVSDWTERRF